MLQISCAVIFWPLKLQSSEYLISSGFLVIAKQRTPKLVISRVCSKYFDSEIRSIEHALRLSFALIYSVTNCEQQQQRIPTTSEGAPNTNCSTVDLVSSCFPCLSSFN